MKQVNIKAFEKVNILSSNSNNPIRQSGTVIVKGESILSQGINEIPEGLEELPQRYNFPYVQDYLESSVLTAILNAAQKGLIMDGCSLYTSSMPSSGDARAIIKVGIIKVYCVTNEFDREQHYGKIMLEEAGIEIEYK